MPGKVRRAARRPGRSDAGGQLAAETYENVSLVAIHQVQSELGAVQDTSKLFSAYVGAVRFVDAAQAAGKLELADADIAAVSGAKLGVPGGGAALLLNPQWSGAGKFLDFAADYRKNQHLIGRVDPVLPPLLAFAAARHLETREREFARISALNQRLREGVAAQGGAFPTLDFAAASPYILHLTVPGHQGAVLMRMLAGEGVMVSAGSACAAESKDPSPAMLALGASRETAYSGLRIGLGRATPDDAPEIQRGGAEKGDGALLARAAGPHGLRHNRRRRQNASVQHQLYSLRGGSAHRGVRGQHPDRALTGESGKLGVCRAVAR